MRKLITTTTLVLALIIGLGAQSPAPLTRSDYGQWESLSFGGARAFSPDGAWLAYGISRANRNNELRFKKIADGTEKVAPFGSLATFSSDSRWAAYSLGYSEAEQERMRTANQTIQNKLGVLDLQKGDTATLDGIQSFSFSGDGKYLAMRRYAPAPPGGGRAGGAGAAPAGRGGGPGGGGGADDTAPVGVTLIVRDLASGRDTTFGNVSDYAWQDSDGGHLLAIAISADGQSGNGVQLYDPATTVLKVLDSSATTYSSIVWRKDSRDLAVLRAKTDDTREGPTQIVLAWRDAGGSAEKRIEFDPTASAASFPANMRTVTYRRPSWSEDGKTVFLGIAAWDAKPPAPPRGRGANGAGASGAGAGGAGESGGRGGRGGGNGEAASQEKDEPAAVDVWHWKDPIVMAQQKLSAAADRRRNLMSAWHLDTGRFVQIGKSSQETIVPIAGSSMALVDDWSAFAMERSIGRPAGDLYLVDFASGARTKIKEHATGRSANVSPGGRFVLFVEGGQYMTIDTKTRTIANLTKGIATSFIDVESDQTSPEKPMFGVGGWTKGDAAVLLYDKFDIWLVPTDGAKPSRLTNGAAEQVRHRYVRINPDDEFVDVSAPAYVSLFGLWSKQSGYGILKTSGSAASGMTGSIDRAVWQDKSVTSLSKATKADVYAYIAQDHNDSPDLFLTTASLTSPKQVTTTNAFQSKYAWSKSELVEYKSEKGLRLEGALYYPAGYQPGRTYPMIVYVYETLSDGVHRYVAPSDRDYYNTTVFTSQGYFVLQPDIIFRPREPGLSVVECVRPAVKAVVDKGLVDAKRVGMVGHSWGGFDTAYMAANTTTFAAAVAGAAITDLVSNYGNHHWSSGIAETDHIETGQQRMVVPIYEDLQAYIRNSAIYNVSKMTTPLMLMTGDNDGTVFWHQAVAMYNIARRAGKNVVMVVYNGEDHGLRQAKNQIDYQQRILAWFGHYLKGDPAPTWITDGQSFLAREAEVKKGGGR